MNLPNLLSFARIFMVPIFIWCVFEGHGQWALWIFVLAGITDALDGYLAKRLGQVTELGGFLDPLADKMLLIAGFVTLTWTHQMPLWLTLLVVTRDLIIIGGAILYQITTGDLKMEPLFISKINTAAQIMVLGMAMAHHNYGWFEGGVAIMVWVVMVTTVVSGVAYIWSWSHRAEGHGVTTGFFGGRE
ncbi:CDP-alcohol phosphatidyltransferase [Magnetococcus marinus MC-1]|uniref:CDP-diacylglycerol--glycerol-3-phosphate 3-phosphatidyltransferase n=1 Tax=Magnetococcus marinus (strain ATCC BAA-1437 / JCM 17883 / MC-1) TaxID=156889 RepID=A0LA21_MAGMM|nr:CDP-alcohol phosphatidyltransferase family protein [Magnetococcus marinus]ABK44814.1 CDP-alcohol phosphatidyltransferase [Magnetococcus marinus MC-1]